MTELAGTKQYLDAFEHFRGHLKEEPSWLREMRVEAIAHFAEQGFPSTRQDAWRYTDMAKVRDSEIAFDPVSDASAYGEIKKFKQTHKGFFLFFINGQYAENYSSIPQGVRVLGLREAAASEEKLLKKYFFCKTSEIKRDAFEALNEAFFDRGIFIHVSERKKLVEQIHIVSIAASDNDQVFLTPRVLALVGRDSQATFVESYVAGNDRPYFTNAFAEIFLDEDAILEHFKIQQEGKNAFHVAKKHIRQAGGSSFASMTLSLGARLMRDESRVELAGPEAQSHLKGLYLAEQEQLLDHHLFMDHQQPSCRSRQLFKGILSGNSRGVFSGKILVRRGAQQTDAQQTNRNLFLSDGAKVDTQPQLEILADDVKCSHGAAVGRLEEDSVFYLKSRGISEKKANYMLAQGFAQEMIRDIAPGSFEDLLVRFVNEKLEKQFADFEDPK
ncbi:MAG TPA: Fe-S cluster assembly protein SufD [Candidatus Omnitrophota bacterium]|nr:Fe-S cluster assembly protein SufD [Candidatus Omnitrophota bacterium]